MRYLAVFALFVPVLANAQPAGDGALRLRAEALSREMIIVDTHIDVPEMLRERWEDISQRLPAGYAEDDVRKISGGNLFRVWRQVETTARQLQSRN
jgi:hypothetical protein